MDRVGSLDPQDPQVRNFLCFASGRPDAARESFNPQKVVMRRLLRQSRNKRAIPASEIDLQRGDTPKNRFQVEGSDVGLRDQFGHGDKMRRQRTGSTPAEAVVEARQ